MAGAPLVITADLVNTFNISLVVRGSVSETGRANDGDRYSVPKAQNIFRCLLLQRTDELCYAPRSCLPFSHCGTCLIDSVVS